MTNPLSNFLCENIAIKRIGNYPDKPTIIFLHDSLGCISLWKNFPQQLSDLAQCNVLVYDRNGYGKSAPLLHEKRDNDYLEKEAEILNRLLDFWNIEKAILFGHSDGGSIALLTAALFPQRVLGVITEGAHIFVEDVTIAGIKEAMLLYQSTDLKSKLQKYHGDKTEAMFRAWTLTWTSEKFRNWNIERYLPFIQCKALIIQGQDDEYGTLEQVDKICEGIVVKASKLVIPNVKHTPHKENPELVLEQSARFIQSVLK